MQFKVPQNYKEISTACLSLFIIGVTFGYGIGPFLLKFCIAKIIKLSPGPSIVRNIYLEIPFPVKHSIYLFNVTNPEVVANGGIPIVQEVGPYVFDVYIKKEIVSENEIEDTLTYDERKYFYFNSEATLPLTGEEKIISPFLIYVGGLLRIHREMPEVLDFIQSGMQSIFSDMTSMFGTFRAFDMIWDGIYIDCDQTDFTAKSVCAAIGAENVEKVDDKHFKASLFKRDNATVLHRMTVKRGTKNSNDLNKMIELNEMDENDLYDGAFCNRFGGFDGSILPPFLSKKYILDIFISQLCRNVRYHATSKKVWHKTIPTQRFVRGRFNDQLPENDCFCYGDSDTCPLEGFMESSICTQIPMVVSEAHGLNADPKFFEMVQGLMPNEEKHSSYVDINLLTGGHLYSRNTFQMNLDIEPISDDVYLKNVAKMYLPYLWLEIVIDNQNALIGLMRTSNMVSFLIFWIKWICLLFGSVGLIVSQVFGFITKVNQREANVLRR